MFRGLYSGASALNYSEHRHQITSANLAHVNSAGHRRAVFSVGEKSSGGNVQGSGSDAGLSNEVDFDSPGRYEVTGRPLDFSIRGEGFFKYQGEHGVVYSRSGAAFRNADGQLENHDGLPLLGDGGPIVIDPEISDRDIAVARDGTISANGEIIGKLAIIKFDDNSLLESETQIDFREGRAIGSPATESSIVQGSRELSNVQPVAELINLIISSRHYEAAQRAIRTIADSMQQNLQE